MVSLDNEGHASVSIATLTEGTHIIEARYSGDANYIFTTGYYDNPGQVVTKLATTTFVSSSMNPSPVGQNVTFTATVTAQSQDTPGPTGIVTFYDMSTSTYVGKVSLDNNGNASISIATLTAGTHIISAMYSGDNVFSVSTGYYNNPGQVVNAVQTSRVTTTAVGFDGMGLFFLGQPVTLNATVTGELSVVPGPSGSVDFFDQSSGTDLGMVSLDNDGHASITINTLAFGSHIIVAHYSGDANFDSSTGNTDQTLNVFQAAIIAISSNHNPSYSGQNVTFTAAVTVPSPGTGTPTGYVDFFDESTGSDLGMASLDNQGNASISIDALTIGTHTIQVNYADYTNYILGTGYYDNPGQVVTVQDARATVTSISSSENPSVFGQPVTFTAIVTAPSLITPGPTGPVVFSDVDSVLGTVNLDSNGTASITTATLTAGTHYINAYYSGDANFDPSTGYMDKTGQVVNPSTTFYRDADGDGYGDPNVTIQASSVPTGYVSNNTDCDDTHATVYPGAPELCDGLDNNCNGQIDEGCAIKNVLISINDKSVKEGNKGQKIMRFQVLLNKKSRQAVTVNYATQDSTAISPGDYIATSGTLTFTAGVKRQSISVYINGDKSIEPDETFTVRLSNPVNAAILDGTAVGTILNNDGTSIAVNAIGAEENVVANTMQLQVSPNPASGKVNITLKGYKGNVVIQLSTIEGKTLRQDKVQVLSGGYAQQSINVSGYANGIYFVTVTDETGNRQTAKLIVQH